MIKDNVFEVEKRIQKACKRCGRERDEITLIAVSKTKSMNEILEAKKEKIMDFGENKVLELCDKYNMDSFIHWHFIGHLQRNKVKHVIDKVAYIHSVDSYRLAEQIQNEAKKAFVVSKILIEINIAEEETKFGVKAEEAEDLLRKISSFSHIQVCGLMTVAPFTENAEKNRLYFRKMKKLLVDMKKKNIDNVTMDMLSMGMTGDYEVAIEEGATHIRVGTGVFGNRIYHM